MGSKQEDHAVWAKRIERLRTSELTDVEFAAELGVNVNTLRAWKYKLRRAGVTPGARQKPRRAKATFVEIAPRAPTLIPEPAAAIEIVLKSDLLVRVPVGFDADTLTRLIDLLGRAP